MIASMHTLTGMHSEEPSGWADYVLRHKGGDRQIDVAQKTGIKQSTISRWLGAVPPQPSAPHVVAFARAYGVPPVQALVAAGVISPDEAAVAS